MQTETITGVTYQEKMTSIMKMLEQGIKDVFTSGRYQEYLTAMSKFHHYSYNNVMLILMQKPDSTHVAGFHTWKSLGRSIKKGSVGIRILAPMIKKLDQDELSADDQTVICGFRIVSIFDIDQTEGATLPTMSEELKATCDCADDFEKAIRSIADCPIEYAALQGRVKGYYDLVMHKIVIKENMSDTMRIKVMCHERCHSRLDRKDAQADQKDRETREVIAESVAFTIMQYFGVDTSSYSWGYIAGWSKTQELTELSSSLSLIQKESDKLIKLISEQMTL